MDLVSELASVTSALHGAGVPYALCGGIAVTLHGHVRATKDIDLLVLPEDRERALGVVAPLGYDVPALPMTFGAGTPGERLVQRVTKFEAGESLTVDFLLVGPVFEAVWASRENYLWEGSVLCVVSRAGLLEMKRLAGRAQDLADVERLESEPEDA